MAISPLISDGSLSLSTTGDLTPALDIVTQMAVGIAAYNCIYDSTVNSALIPYLNNKLLGTTNRSTLTNIVVSAYQSMITAKIISNLKVSIRSQTISTVNINVSAVDDQGNQISINWIN